MIDLENKIERDKLIDDYFNKGYACDIREVYQAVVNTIADLEYANDEKADEIERLNKRVEDLKTINEEHQILNGMLRKEIDRLNNIIEEAIKGIEDYYYGDKEYKEYDYTLAYQIYHILKGENNE